MDRALMSTSGATPAFMSWRIAACLCVLPAVLPVRGQAEEFHDPTRPVFQASQSAPAAGAVAPQVGVGMVVTAKEGVMALRNGRILHVGSRIDEGVVVRIASDAVFVRSAKGQERRLPLYPEVNLTPVVPGTRDGDRSTRK